MRQGQINHATVRVPKPVRAGHAAYWYSWEMPPRLSRRVDGKVRDRVWIGDPVLGALPQGLEAAHRPGHARPRRAVPTPARPGPKEPHEPKSVGQRIVIMLTALPSGTGP